MTLLFRHTYSNSPTSYVLILNSLLRTIRFRPTRFVFFAPFSLLSALCYPHFFSFSLALAFSLVLLSPQHFYSPLPRFFVSLLSTRPSFFCCCCGFYTPLCRIHSVFAVLVRSVLLPFPSLSLSERYFLSLLVPSFPSLGTPRFFRPCFSSLNSIWV